MRKQQNFQPIKGAMAVLDYMSKELQKEEISNECIDRPEDKKMNVPEIITPHPYSLYTLCQNYEHFQRN